MECKKKMDGIKKKIPSEMKEILDKERVREGREVRWGREADEAGRWEQVKQA